MSDRCEPPEGLRGVDGWHWVAVADREIPAHWHASHSAVVYGFWTSDQHVPAGTGKWAAQEWGWRYLAPVAPPAEVNALRAELAAVRGVNDMLLATMQRIAKRDFNCAPHQHGMAAQAAAEAAITAANVATALGDAA